MKIPSDLKYSTSHQWVKLEGNKAYIGLTDFGQDDLGDIFFIELPELNEEVLIDGTIGTTESAKAVSTLLSPLMGKVIAVNEKLDDEPNLINEAPYDNWILALALTSNSNLDHLMDHIVYEKFCAEINK